MYRICTAIALCLICASAQAQDHKFEFKSNGYRLESRYGDVFQDNGFRVSGKGKKEAKAAIQTAHTEMDRQHWNRNMDINTIGEAGHGVDYPTVVVLPPRPVFVQTRPVFVPVPVYRPYGW